MTLRAISRLLQHHHTLFVQETTVPTSKEHASELIKEAIARSNKASPGQIKTIKSLNSKVTDEYLDGMTMKQASAMITALFAVSARKKKEEGGKRK